MLRWHVCFDLYFEPYRNFSFILEHMRRDAIQAAQRSETCWAEPTLYKNIGALCHTFGNVSCKYTMKHARDSSSKSNQGNNYVCVCARPCIRTYTYYCFLLKLLNKYTKNKKGNSCHDLEM